MVSMWDAVFLGIVQGATEFLPISSSAHLVLFALWMRENPAGLTFDLMLHVGTLGAVLIYFRKEWKNLAIQLVRLLFASKKETSDFRLAAALFWGTLPALLAGALFEGGDRAYPAATGRDRCHAGGIWSASGVGRPEGPARPESVGAWPA